MSKITIVIGAGETAHVAINARFLRVMSSSAPFDIEIDGRKGYAIEQGVAVEAPNGVQIGAADITSATAQTIVLVPEELHIFDNRLTLTDGAIVNVKDDAYEKAANLQAFEMYHMANAVVGKFGGVMLWNPAGSGKLLKVRQIVVSSTGQAEYQIQSKDNLNLSLWSGAYGGDAKRMSAGTEAASGVMYSTGTVGLTSSSLDTLHYYRYFSVLANSMVNHVVEYPWIITEGVGLAVVSQNANTEFTASFEWEEGA